MTADKHHPQLELVSAITSGTQAPILIAFGIEFYQQANGKMHPLLEGAVLALTAVDTYKAPVAPAVVNKVFGKKEMVRPAPKETFRTPTRPAYRQLSTMDRSPPKIFNL